MPNKMLITNAKQVTPEWLTNTLLSNGALTQGKVTSIETDKGSGNWSSNAKLRLHYSEDAQGEMPEHLFLKIVSTDLGDEFFGDSEVTYYTRDYIGVPNAPLVRCYDAAFSEEKQQYHLLLDDISETHKEARTVEYSMAYGEALVEGLATLHARWWGAERLSAAKVEMHSPAHIKRYVEIAEPGMGHILETYTDQLAPHWPALMQELFAKHPQAMINRTKNANGFTLVHGDMGAGNIMVPHEGNRPIYFIDRQPFDWSLTNWLGVSDIS
ncbi:MAG: aminoglycoside phosphotransferase family protein, partial [Chloroflexota bacterium]